MADTKISALTALTGVNVDTAADVLPIVDTSASATKKITVDELKIALAIVATTTYPKGYIYGCTLSNNGSDATNDIDIAAGKARDSTDAVNMSIAAMTKQLDAGWAAGTNQGFRNSAIAIANTTYHVYAVTKADGTQDFYAHTSTTVATVITALQLESGGTDYLYARRIGSIVRASAAIKAFIQDGDDFYWKVPVADINASSTGTAAVTRTLTLPIGLRIKAYVTAGAVVTAAGNTVYHYLSDLSSTDTAASVSAAHVAASMDAAASTEADGFAPAEVWTNTSAQIRSRSSVNSAFVKLIIDTLGWRDARDRL